MFGEVNGVAKAVRKLVIALARRGHEVHVFAPNNSIRRPELNVAFHRCKGFRMGPEYYSPIPLLKYVRAKRYKGLDVCHSMTPITVGSLGLDVAKVLGVPKVATHHSPLAFYTKQYFPVIGGLVSPVMWKYERLFYNRFHLVTTPTPSKKELIQRYSGIRDPILCLTNGIEDYYFKKVDANEAKERFGVGDRKMVLYVGRHSREKNLPLVLRAFKRVLQDVDAHLVLAGDGPERQRVERHARELGINDRVTFTGFVSSQELLKLYAAADVTTLFSFVEAEGLVLLEAMAQGTPSVGARASGIKDVIRHGETGFLVKNVGELAESLTRVLLDDELRGKLGANARNYARHHRMDVVVDAWERIYETLVDFYPMFYHGTATNEQVNEIFRDLARTTPGLSF